MAKVILGSNENFTVSNDNAFVFGVSGTGTEKITLASGSKGLTVDQNIEGVVFTGASTDYYFKQAGNGLQVYKTDGTTLLATIKVQGDTDGSLLTFTNGTASAKLSAAGMTLGGAAVSSTAAGSVTPTLDTGTASPITYTLTAGSSVTESNSTTFDVTVKASAAVTAAQTLTYSITGSTIGSIATAGTAGTDFTPAVGQVAFAVGDTQKTFSIRVPNDGVSEGLEGMKITLLDSNYATLDSKQVTILDGADLPMNFNLTKNADVGASFQGGVADDTFLGTMYLNTASLNADQTTLNISGDNLDGGAGNDTLSISGIGTMSGSSLSILSTPTLRNIENVIISDTTDGGSGFYGLNMQGADSSVNLVGTDYSTNTGGTGGVEFVMMNKLVNAEMGGASNLLLHFNTTVVSGTSDALNLSLLGVGSSSRDSQFHMKNGGIETLNLSSAGGLPNYLELNSGDAFGTAVWGELKTVKVTGSKDLTLDLNNETNSTTGVAVDASSFSGALTVSGVSLGAVTLVGGAGNDVFDFSSGGTSSYFDAGTGTTAKDSLVGGDGTDTLKLGVSSTGVVDSQFKNASSIEVLSLGSGSTGTLAINADTAGIVKVIDGTGAGDVINLTLSSGFDNAITVELHGTGGDTVDSSGSQSALTVKFASGSTGFAIDSLTASTGSGIVDVLELTAGASGTLGSSVTNFDKIVVDANGSSGITLATVNDNVSGGKTLTVDATALTNTSAALSFTGTAETDGKFSILGGAGNDVIYLGSGNDTVLGGDGKDTIYGTVGGNDSILGGAGNDTINMGSYLSSGDYIDGGDGSDTLIVTSSTVTSSDFNNVTGIETLGLNAASVSLTGNISFSTFDLAASDSGTTLTFGSGYTHDSTVNLGSGDSVVNTANINMTGYIDENNINGTVGVTGGTGTDVLYIMANTGTTDIILATGAKIDTLYIQDMTGTGVGADISVVATGYLTNLKVDATELDAGGTGTAGSLQSTLDETLTFTATGTSNKFIVLGGGGADTITLGSGADSVLGGAGTDLIVGGAGNDTLDGGDGNDSLVSGPGNDSLLGGAGNDSFYMGDSFGTAAGGYLDNADTLSGGDGVDSLYVQGTGGLGFSFGSITSIENLYVMGGGAGTTGTVNLYSQAQTAGISTVYLNDPQATLNVDAGSYTSALTFDLMSSSGATSILGGQGDDTFLVYGTGAVLTAGDDALKGGAGTDTLQINNGTGAGLPVSVAIGPNDQFEKIVVNDQSASTGTSGDVTINFGGFGTTGITLTVDGSSLDNGETLTLASGSNLAGSQALSVLGGAGSDTLILSPVKDTVDGGDGNDTISGGSGNDSLTGGNGADSLLGGAGQDTLTGGADADAFVFSSSSDSTYASPDTITDFVTGTDSVRVQMNLGSAAGGSFNAGLVFGGTTSDIALAGPLLSANKPGQYAYANGTNKQLAIDVNGNALIQSDDVVINLPNTTGFVAADLGYDITMIAGAGNSGTLVGGSGSDSLNLNSSGGDNITLSSIESIYGSTGTDTIVIASGGVFAGTVSDAGGGFSLGVSNYSGADSVTLTSSNGSGLSFNLGSGADTLTIQGVSNTGSFTGGTQTDTLVLTGTGNVITIDGVESITGSTGVDDVIFGSSSSETGSVFGGTGAAIVFDSAYGTSSGAVDTIDLNASNTADQDTIVFGTGAGTNTASGDNLGLTIANFDMGSGTTPDVLNLSALTDYTGFSTTGAGGAATWYAATGSAADIVATGAGVIFVSSTGTDGFDSTDISTSSGASGNLVLSTGDVDYVVVFAGTGTADSTLDLYLVNASADGTSTTFTDSDIKLIGTVSLISGQDATWVTASSFSLA